MSVKFKIGFTMDAETLFGMMSKFLPVQDLHVEEIIEQPAPEFVPSIKPKAITQHKPKQKRRPQKPLDLKAGINRIIIEAMADGEPHRSIDLKPLLEKGGYSPNSVGSRLQNLEEHGAVKRQGDGTWRLTSSLVERESA
jgi:DNA-binding transcriptional ArsR family regulator